LIDSYNFGSLVIDGKEYTNDVIILQSTVRDNWWRKEGHNLCLDDLVDATKNEPDVIIVGTGNLGLMKISDELIEKLKSKGIRVIVQRTKAACETFNKLLNLKQKVVAAFHLTC
jgi:hypothetical protein